MKQSGLREPKPSIRTTLSSKFSADARVYSPVCAGDKRLRKINGGRTRYQVRNFSRVGEMACYFSGVNDAMEDTLTTFSAGKEWECGSF